MKIKVNYTIQDMFKHNQQITAEKSNPSYLDLIILIDKMGRLNPLDYVLFIELENNDNPIAYLTIYYDTVENINSKTLTVQYHNKYNGVSACKEPVRKLKKWLGDYMKENGLWEEQR